MVSEVQEDSWGAYARFQERLAGRSRVDGQAWGLEGALNRVLLGATEGLDRALESERRKDRHRSKLRRVYLAIEDSTGHLEDAVDARLRLRAAKAMVSPDQWTLLRAVADGYEYGEIAAWSKCAPGTLRVRVLRIRRALVVHAA